MSLTLAERQRWIAELHRLNAEGWREHKLSRVQAIQASTGLSFERAWDQAEREQQNPAPEPTSISEATRLIQAEHPGWSFQQSWDFAESTYPKLVKGADTLTRDPRISQEFAKLKKLGDVARSAKIGDHVALLAKIRKLMQEQNLSFDQAFTEIIKQEHEIKKTAAARQEETPPWTGPETIGFDEWLANVQKRQAERKARVEAIEEPWPTGKKLFICGSEGFFVD